MYKCKKCKEQSKPGEPQSKIYEYDVEGRQIISEEKVCFYCKEKEKKNE